MRKKEKNIIELGEEFAENKKIEQGYYTTLFIYGVYCNIRRTSDENIIRKFKRI